MKENGYPGQMLYVNTEIAKDLQEMLKKMELDGKVPLGTADRVVDSGVSIEQAKRVARAGTKESIMFDAETALPTAILAFVAVGAVVFICNLKKKELLTKKLSRKL